MQVSESKVVKNKKVTNLLSNGMVFWQQFGKADSLSMTVRELVTEPQHRVSGGRQF
jgi:hypothetical protein